MAAKKRSEVWDHFKYLVQNGQEDKNTTVCSLCASEFKHATGSISSMSANLKRKHNINMKDSRLVKSKTTLMTAEKTVCKQSSSSSTIGKRQLDLKDVLLRKNKLSTSSTRHKSIKKSIGIFLAKDMRPYSVVQGF